MPIAFNSLAVYDKYMHYDKEKRSENATKELRGGHGQFVSKDQPKKSHKITGAGDLISKFIKTEKGKDEETLVDLKITNPLHRITQILQDIKNHQSTTFSFKFTIPLIALPVFLLIAFQLGRSQTACSEVFSSKIGTIKNIQVLAPKEKNDTLANFFSFVPFVSRKTSNATLEERALLINSQNELFTILRTKPIDLTVFENQNVIISGTISNCAHTISLDSPQNITIR